MSSLNIVLNYEQALYLIACVILGALMPSFAKKGVKKSAPVLCAAIVATLCFVFSLGAILLGGEVAALTAISNDALLRCVISGIFGLLVLLSMIAALSTGNINRVLSIYYLLDVLKLAMELALGRQKAGLWRLCCIVLVLLGIVLLQSRRKREKGYRWLLFSVCMLVFALGKSVYDGLYLTDVSAVTARGIEYFTAAAALWILALAGKSGGQLKNLKPEDWIFLLLTGFSLGLVCICSDLALRMGPVDLYAPMSCLLLPLTLAFGRLFHKEKTPGAGWFGAFLVTAGYFGLMLGV